jgi:putative ABC transport system permease protein
MGLWGEILRRAQYISRRSKVESELDEEVRFHIETRASELEQSGTPRPAAVSQAGREFGHATVIREDMREAWQFRWLEQLRRDLTYAVRSLARTPAFALTAIACLALGIGANAAIFTVTSALLLRPFPYSDPEQLVSVRGHDNRGESGGNDTLLRYELVRDSNKSFQSIAVWANDNLNLTGAGEPVQVSIARVSAGFFTLLGVHPQTGRTFTEEEGWPEGKQVVILSDALWRSRFHADPAIAGKTLTLDSTPQTIIGVLPANLQFPFVGPADIWTPRYFELSLMSPQGLRAGVGYLDTIARLKPGTNLGQGNAELAILNQRYREQNPGMPDAGPGVTMSAQPLRDIVVSDVRGKILMLTAAVGVLLLIACANVASLLLSRALARRREIAVRTALGASRGTVVRQLLTESLLLAIVAGAVGVALGWAATRALAIWGASQLPDGIPIGLDLRVLLFTLGISLLAGIVFGTAPALQLASVDLNTALRDEGRGTSAGRARGQARNLLVVSQVALSLLLLVGAGLLLRSFVELLRVKPGFDSTNVLTMDLNLPTVKYSTRQKQIAFFDELLRRVSPLPGVRNAAISAALPLSSIRMSPVLAEGQPNVPLAGRPIVDVEAVSPKWFETLRVPLLAGRDFTAADDATAPKVVIVNQTFARRFWPDQNPVGKHIIIGRGPGPSEVIAVAADIRNRGIDQSTQAQLYLAFPQLPWGNMNLLLRTSMPPLSVTSVVRAQIAAMDPEQPITKVQTLEAIMDTSRAQPRFTALLVGIFSLTALALAVIGIYGVLSYSVAQRTQEFGIRLALGAERADIQHLVLRQALTLAIAGIAIGIVAALMLTRLAGSMLYKTGARDPVTFVLAPLIFLAVALLASSLPARRATKVDPMEALR